MMFGLIIILLLILYVTVIAVIGVMATKGYKKKKIKPHLRIVKDRDNG